MVNNMSRKKKVKVLAFDTSSNKTGWALFINGKYAESGVIDLHKHKNSEERIKEMCLSITSLIFDKSPNHVVIEQLPSTRNADTTRKLSRIIGAVFYYCISNNIEYSEMPCSTWRKLVGIENSKRNKAKADSMNHVLQKYKLDINDDEADAINICEAYCINHNYA
jgi:Holliday junction resolvasome RuvABC endonuclease subunit